METIFQTMAGKRVVVTGAASGFGEGLARGFAARGADVALADMNEAGVKATAEKIAEETGLKAIGLAVNVADEESVRNLIKTAANELGGLDVMVSCAGIAIAGDLGAMTRENFDKVAAVNYTGYFLCAKYASSVMKAQREKEPDRTFDIIQINSKSGVVGSKANFAYAGSKFGGIGLTQSFALELAPYGIKVNSICPGNLLDGPLWSDPEKGLLKQYLDAGKVRGATTIDDVRRHYEAMVPMGRGCRVEDVVRAAVYLVEQQYETGQALPVTGGQLMLG